MDRRYLTDAPPASGIKTLLPAFLVSTSRVALATKYSNLLIFQVIKPHILHHKGILHQYSRCTPHLVNARYIDWKRTAKLTAHTCYNLTHEFNEMQYEYVEINNYCPLSEGNTHYLRQVLEWRKLKLVRPYSYLGILGLATEVQPHQQKKTHHDVSSIVADVQSNE
jgi:hypothetical protein